MRYIYCHPLFDERKCSHRFSYQLMKTFQKAGLRLERFDYTGTGHSTGEFSNLTIETILQDISRQVGSDNICLIGLRFGASAAFEYCRTSSASVKTLVLVEPVIDGAAYTDHLRRKQKIKDLVTGMKPDIFSDIDYENIEGYKTSISFLKHIQSISLIDSATKYRGNRFIAIAEVTKRSRHDPEFLRLQEVLSLSVKHTVIKSFELLPFWERLPEMDYSELTEQILRWCCE